jgi:hypothetical protein
MEAFLKNAGVAANEAKTLAKQFSKDSKALIDFAAATSAAEAQQKAYYSAMAAQAQSMIDLAKYTEEEINQMSSVVNADLVEQYSDKMEQNYADDDAKETEAELKAYMESLEGIGEVKKIRDNKVVYIDEEGKKQKVDKKVYLEQMKAAKATEMAANAMEQVPNAIDNAAKAFGDGAKAFEKAFTAAEGRNLNLHDLGQLGDIAPDEQGNYAQEGMLAEAWKSLSQEERNVWGDDFQKFAKDYDNRIDLAREAFTDAIESMRYLDFEGSGEEMFGKLSAENAEALAEDLSTIAIGGNDAHAYKAQIDNLLAGLDEE